MSTIRRMLIAPVVTLAVAFGLVLSGLGMIPAHAAGTVTINLAASGVATVQNGSDTTYSNCEVGRDQMDRGYVFGSIPSLYPGYTGTFQMERAAADGDIVYVYCPAAGVVAQYTYKAPIDPNPQPQPEIFKKDFRVQKIGIGKIRVVNNSKWTVMGRVNGGDVFILSPRDRETIKTSAAKVTVYLWLEDVSGTNTQVVFETNIRQKAPKGKLPKNSQAQTAKVKVKG